MAHSRQVSFDFDKMADLFKADPEAFEEERRRIIEQEIASRPPEIRQKLRQFQWVLDMKRRRCKNPLEACFMYHEMLMDQVYGPDGLLENLESLKQMLISKAAGKAPSATGLKAVETRIVDISAARSDAASGRGNGA